MNLAGTTNASTTCHMSAAWSTRLQLAADHELTGFSGRRVVCQGLSLSCCKARGSPHNHTPKRLAMLIAAVMPSLKIIP